MIGRLAAGRWSLPSEAHTDRPWRIHEIAHDFELEDVWALPTPGGPDDFDRLLAGFGTTGAPEEDESPMVRFIWAVRRKLGEWFGWDREDAGIGSRVPSLRDRLPDDLRTGPTGPQLAGVPFTALFRTEDEWAAETANSTVHGVLHVGWVPDGSGGYRGQMAVLVKPNGLLGRAYLAVIKPFRYLIIYPALMRKMERTWRHEMSTRLPC